ncbi:MAG: glycosyltransferase, partial [Lachnospiraceae bacterium]|nr:glycosyltransferase [Lachnospiraceae bacterium]
MGCVGAGDSFTAWIIYGLAARKSFKEWWQWKGTTLMCIIEKPLVSILCLSYNHQKYIKQCLDSLLMQETLFDYEIIVNDDCSIDGTVGILKEYEEKYKGKLRVIYHNQNEYSIKKNIPLINLFEAARGVYLAFCECDDFWNDLSKLQKQICYLQTHSDVYAIYHNVNIIDGFGKNTKHEGSFSYKQEHICNLSEFTSYGRIAGQLSSLVCRNFWKELPCSCKNFFQNSVANGDQLIYITNILNGNVFYIEPRMSTYRYITSEGTSWSAVTKSKNLCLFRCDLMEDIKKYAYLLCDAQIDIDKYLDRVVANAIYI